MLRKFWFLVVVFGVVLPGWAADRQASISGYVRSADGVPQMGALVEVLGSAFQSLRLFTNEDGFYSATGIAPGFYDVKVSAPSFLPSLRERIGLRPGSTATVNVTLSTLFDSIKFGPARDPKDQDDWKWVLRSSVNRPPLRVLSGTSAPASSGDSGDFAHDLTGTLSFVAGTDAAGYGSNSDMSAEFRVQKPLFSAGTMALSGNLGYGSSSPAGVVRASYSHRLSTGSEPQVALTLRRLASPDSMIPNSALQSLSLTTSDDLNFGNVLRLQFGSEMETVQFMGRVSTLRPYGSAELHLSPDTLVQYAYTTALPGLRGQPGFDSAPAGLNDSGPRMSISNFAPAMERAHHQEISISQREGKTNVQVAFYADRVANPALVGVGELSGQDGNVLADPFSGTFTYRGADLDTRGVRLVLERKITADMKATLDYEFGGVLDIASRDDSLENASSAMTVKNRASVAGKVAGSLPKTKTRWAASYRWVNAEALTPVDMFNDSPGQSAPYLNIFIHQPIPGTGFLPGHMEAVIDLSNLLAQGYVPLLGQDGRTVYLVQSARAVRGGLAFSF
jgi:hypothetical protein